MNHSSTDKKNTGCNKYTATDLALFVRGRLSPEAAEAFLAHTAGCDDCRIRLYAAHRGKEAEQDQRENELLLQKTLGLLHNIDEGVVSIVVKAARGLVELIRTSGEALNQTPALAGVRSSAGEPEHQEQVIRVRKEFPESFLSVEVTITPQQPEQVGIRLSILETRGERFLENVSVKCTWESGAETRITGGEGIVEFCLPADTAYEFEMSQNEQLLGTVYLDVLVETS